jgi:PAS domain-containing protein
MFSQVVEGRTSDPAGVRRAMDGWVEALPDRSVGWLGGTAGVTPDGRFIAVVRFATDEDARRLSEPAQQQRWWAELRAALDGDPVVRRGTRTEVFSPGDPSGAGFVQVVQGQVTDLDAARRQLHALQDLLQVHLPCLLGTVTVEHADRRFTRVLHFTTEDEARAGEADLAPPVRDRDQEAVQLLDGLPEFLDLREPWLYVAPSDGLSPRAGASGSRR